MTLVVLYCTSGIKRFLLKNYSLGLLLKINWYNSLPLFLSALHKLNTKDDSNKKYLMVFVIVLMHKLKSGSNCWNWFINLG